MSRFSKDINKDGHPVTMDGVAMSKDEIINQLNGQQEQIKRLCEDYQNLASTEPGKYCCCGECS